jgi:uncharacterized protein (TIGR02466 family)
MDMNYDAFFSTIIASKKYDKHEEIELKLKEHCLDLKSRISAGGKGWISNKTYNTSDGQYEIYKDKEFEQLTKWIEKQIYDYCDETGIDNSNLENSGSWFNIYYQGDYQEKHVHPNSIISAIYILCASVESAKIYFSTPLNEMFYVKYQQQKQQLVQQISCQSIPGTLIVFPSYLPHSVERHDSTELRISLSYNYKQVL